MVVSYFPGCTLHSRARGLDVATRASLAALGVELAELPRWTCCGAVFPLTQDNYMGMIAAARILGDAAKEGDGRLVTVCSFCFNVLKRVNYAIKNKPEARIKLNTYLEEDYAGETRVVHPLELLRDGTGFDVLHSKVNGKFAGLKVACYYGCMLVRPAEEMEFGSPENPSIMEEFTAALGAEPVEFSSKTKCCGSYQLLNSYDLVVGRARDILLSVVRQKAQAVITSCPLCQFNLVRAQAKIAGEDDGFKKIPVLYFTQLLGAALDLPAHALGLEENYVDPGHLLSIKN
ncbi:MAG: CoB--CoM heterodisulfide reductase iron-sulfur subunit B family protein [Eubacteriales bacterium]